VRGEDDDADVGVTEHGELLGLLQQPRPALAEGHLAVHWVLNAAQLDSASRHGCQSKLKLLLLPPAHNLPLVWTSFEVPACLCLSLASIHTARPA
jgi:hypothetical protein